MKFVRSMNRELSKKNVLSPAFFLGFLLLILSGCDETFEPVQNSDTVAFSMYGYLDATADTQWVRVAPLRQTANTPAVIPEMTVTLEHVETGDKVVMKDSLFHLVGDYYAVNVFSDEFDIVPDQTYKIRAERLDGASSQVTVKVPPDYPTPVFIGEGFYEESGNLYLKGLENISDVIAIWQIEGEVHSVPYRSNIREYTEAEFEFEYDYYVGLSNRKVMRYIFGEKAPPPYATCLIGQGYVDKRQIFIALGGPDWIDGTEDLEDQMYALPQVLSNVENGVGYVIGIVSKTIPFKTCYDEQGEAIACPLEKPLRISTGITSEEAASCID
ncbi:MAG: hypothetical protein WD604_04600 [Balneolaceae bacterium]